MSISASFVEIGAAAVGSTAADTAGAGVGSISRSRSSRFGPSVTTAADGSTDVPCVAGAVTATGVSVLISPTSAVAVASDPSFYSAGIASRSPRRIVSH
jgi:hypothetical protein